MQLLILAYIAATLSYIAWDIRKYRTQSAMDTQDIIKAIKNVELEVKDLKNTLHPPEKRHFR